MGACSITAVSAGPLWRELVRILLISAGVSGRCCLFKRSCWNGSEGHVPELTLGFGATGFDDVQLIFICPACETPTSAEIAKGMLCHRDGLKSIAAPETVTMTVSPPKTIG